jgi:hypothetical protein
MVNSHKIKLVATETDIREMADKDHRLKSSTVLMNLSHMHPVHTFLPCFPKIHSDIFFPSAPSLPFIFINLNKKKQTK